MKIYPTKDPDEVVDYDYNWATNRLETGETLVTSTWFFETGEDAGCTIDSMERTDTIAKVWVSGGTGGLTATITNRVTTSGLRTYDVSAQIPVRNSGDC